MRDWLELTCFGGSSDLSVQELSCQEDALAQQVERAPTEHTPDVYQHFLKTIGDARIRDAKTRQPLGENASWTVHGPTVEAPYTQLHPHLLTAPGEVVEGTNIATVAA